MVQLDTLFLKSVAVPFGRADAHDDMFIRTVAHAHPVKQRLRSPQAQIVDDMKYSQVPNSRGKIGLSLEVLIPKISG